MNKVWLLAAVAFSKAQLRQQCAVVTTSIGPGATNVVTAAAVAMANRLPMLILSGDTFQSRRPDPVLQQVEHFDSPITTVNDSFRAVTKYWDRINRPEQLLNTLPNMIQNLARSSRLRSGISCIATRMSRLKPLIFQRSFSTK